MYRVHEDPDIEKMLDFNEFIHNFGYHLKGIGDGIHPKSTTRTTRKRKGQAKRGLSVLLCLDPCKKQDTAMKI